MWNSILGMNPNCVMGSLSGTLIGSLNENFDWEFSGNFYWKTNKNFDGIQGIRRRGGKGKKGGRKRNGEKVHKKGIITFLFTRATPGTLASNEIKPLFLCLHFFLQLTLFILL